LLLEKYHPWCVWLHRKQMYYRTNKRFGIKLLYSYTKSLRVQILLSFCCEGSKLLTVMGMHNRQQGLLKTMYCYEAQKYVLTLLFHIFSDLRKTVMSSWNPQWQVRGHWCSIWHMTQNKLEWSENTQLPWQQHEKICRTRPGHLLWGLILWYDNANPHNIQQTHEFHWELLVSSTTYIVQDLPDQTVIC